MAQEIKSEEIVLNENEIVCLLTNKIVKVSEKENNLQYMIQMMSEEYGFPMEDMQKDFSFKYENEDGKKKTAKVTLAIFENGKEHVQENMIRAIVVAKDAKVKDSDKKGGVMASLENVLTYTNCDFGCWTNGEDLKFIANMEDEWGQISICDYTDFLLSGRALPTWSSREIRLLRESRQMSLW